MQESVIQRVSEILKEKCNGNISVMSRTIGISQTTCNNYFLNKRKPSLEFVEAILNSFEDISAEWLLRGKGSMTGNTPVETPIYNNSDIYDLIDKFNDASQRARMLAEENNRLKEELNLLNNSRKMKKA